MTNTDAIAARQVTLPLYPALSDKNVLAVVEAVRDSLAGLGVSSKSGL